jgi:hypothetical protein
VNLYLNVLYYHWVNTSAIRHRGYHPPSSHCYDTDMVYQKYLLLKFTRFLNNVIINTTKVLLPQATLFRSFGFIAPKTLHYVTFQSFYFERHLMKDIPETCRPQSIWYVFITKHCLQQTISLQHYQLINKSSSLYILFTSSYMQNYVYMYSS